MSNSPHTSAQPPLPNSEPLAATVAENRTPLTVLGIVLMLTGGGALALPFAGALAIDMVVATAFVVTGVVYFGKAFGSRSFGGFAWEMILGLVYLAAGLFLVLQPIEGTLVLTAIIALSLIADGIVRTAVSIAMRRGPWGWMLVSGILAIVLGFAVFAMPAGNAVLLLGALVGLNLFASGLAFVMVAANASSDSETNLAAEQRGEQVTTPNA